MTNYIERGRDWRGDMDAQSLAAHIPSTGNTSASRIRLDRLTAQWQSHLAAHGKSLKTIKTYTEGLKRLTDWATASGADLLALAEADAEHFVEYLYAKKLSSASIKLHAQSAKQFYRWLVRQKIVPQNPFAELPPIRAKNKSRDWLSQAEIKALLAGDPLDAQAQAILELLYGSGLRNAELRGLRVGDVLLDDCLVRVTGKGGDEEYQPITLRAAQALRTHLATKALSPRDPLFQSNWKRPLSDSTLGRIVRLAGRDAGLSKPIYPHLLRHTYATHLLENGADLREVQELLRHANIATTTIYAHVAKPRLKEILGRCHPMAQPVSPAEWRSISE